MLASSPVRGSFLAKRPAVLHAGVTYRYAYAFETPRFSSLRDKWPIALSHLRCSPLELCHHVLPTGGPGVYCQNTVYYQRQGSQSVVLEITSNPAPLEAQCCSISINMHRSRQSLSGDGCGASPSFNLVYKGTLEMIPGYVPEVLEKRNRQSETYPSWLS